MGSIEDHDPLCGKIADECRAVVIAAEYRLAPEHPFPACIEDAAFAAEWALKNARTYGGDPDRIVPALQKLAGKCLHLVIVTNDLFSDGMEYSPSVQEYLRCLAEINRQTAELADCVVEVVYSIPLAVKGELPCLCSDPS